METINRKELSFIVASELPEIRDEIGHIRSKENVAGVMQAVVNYMRDMARGRQIDKIVRRMKLVGWVYGRTDSAIRETISNVFVRSFNGLRNRCSNWDWTRIQQQMPSNLYSVYAVQNRVLKERV
ncbi:hypothetical protein GCM10007415_32200 [Parapedobacter pyrenivorans]|uniref:DUF7674 domain-containing protein n=1 Tax=Parapedobacter pyrenivorans TaxID=1305674 RepID=A0A917HXJ2_9SPHI|nr:hypothetical protein [Parapedobacter pyrenivorans]GGG94679.1 hypothetical protein GCM10007415_32200 [Parapedobacter pyrenivorans]